MSKARGLDLQNRLAEYLAGHGWPAAQSVGSGRPGADILGTPGIAWENKTADEFRILEFVAQAKANAGPGGCPPGPHACGLRCLTRDVPVVAYWPRGAGARSVELIPTIIPMAWTVRLLRGSGYGDPLEPAEDAWLAAWKRGGPGEKL